MGVRVLLVVADSATRIAYTRELLRLQVEVECVPCIADLHRVMAKVQLSGLLLDGSALNSASLLEKAFLHDLVQLFPTAKLRWDEAAQKVLLSYYGLGEGMGDLATFVQQQCLPFQPRTIRDTERMALYFNVLVATAPDATAELWHRSVTMNISVGGCFVVSTEQWDPTRPLWLRFMELSDPAVIPATVCWYKPWGKSMGIPGLGLRFVRLSDSQREQLDSMIRHFSLGRTPQH